VLSSSADEAWELVRTHRPDIVLSDIAMPAGMSGAELCQRIKSTPELAATYVILMTAFATSEWEGARYQHRPDAFLRKPFHLPELREKIEAAIRACELLRLRHAPLVAPAVSEREQFQHFLRALIRLRSPSLEELAQRVERACHWLAEHAEALPDSERELLPLAGLAYVLGRLALPEHLLREPLTRGGRLSHELLLQVPLGAATVCRTHPLLAAVAPIVASVAENYDGSGVPDHLRAWEIPAASRLLRLAVDFEELLWSSPQPPAVVAAYMERLARQAYDVQLLPLILQYASVREATSEVVALGLHELRAGMVLAHDVHTRSGLKLATAGTVLTEQLLERLTRHHTNDPIVGVILVQRSHDTG
jgi:response regulator RpfG family c-di-GMP phosphodiesterase